MYLQVSGHCNESSSNILGFLNGYDPSDSGYFAQFPHFTIWHLTNFHTLIFDKFPHFDIWQISTLWSLMSSSMHLTTCHRDPSTISSSWHFAWYDGEKCLPGNHCNHHLVVVSQGFYASKNLGQFSYSCIWIRVLSAHIKKNSKSLRVAQFLFVGKVPRMGAYLNYRAFPKW